MKKEGLFIFWIPEKKKWEEERIDSQYSLLFIPSWSSQRKRHISSGQMGLYSTGEKAFMKLVVLFLCFIFLFFVLFCYGLFPPSSSLSAVWKCCGLILWCLRSSIPTFFQIFLLWWFHSSFSSDTSLLWTSILFYSILFLIILSMNRPRDIYWEKNKEKKEKKMKWKKRRNN